MKTGLQTISTAALAAMALVFCTGGGMKAATLKTLHSFCASDVCADGLNPANGLLRDAQGNLYGETTERGAFGHGTVFQLYRPPGKTRYRVRVLHDFCFGSGGGCTGGDGAGMGGHLIIDVHGAVYGVAGVGGSFGAGTVFKLIPHNGGKRWSLRELYAFCSAADCPDGGGPASLTYAGASSGAPYDGTSTLYGVAEFGGKNGNGVAFRLIPKRRGEWAERVLYDFCDEPACADGANPAFDLLLDESGNLFGVTLGGGGDNNPGLAFKLSPTDGARWKETVLHAFCSATDCADGSGPAGGLVMDAGGQLLGVTAGGGNPECLQGFGCGVVYKIAPDGNTSVAHTFCSENNCADGSRPSGRLMIDPSGDLFGTTVVGGAHQGGTIFRLSGGTYDVVFDFCSGACGGAPTEPLDGVILDPAGSLLGTAGGGTANLGTVFELHP